MCKRIVSNHFILAATVTHAATITRFTARRGKRHSAEWLQLFEPMVRFGDPSTFAFYGGMQPDRRGSLDK